MTTCRLRIHGLLLFLDLHQPKPPCLWLWDPTQRFQIIVSNDLYAATIFYQRLIIVLASVDSYVVRRYKISQISQRVTHKSSKHLQNVARVSLLYVEKFRWNLKRFCRLGPVQKFCRKTMPAIFDWSSLILNRSSKTEPHFLFLHLAGLEPWNNHF